MTLTSSSTAHLLFRPLSAAALTLLLAGALPATAAAPATTETAGYQRDRAHCMNFKDHGERADCLSEASTAHMARMPPQVDTDPGRYERNALERCKPLREPDRQDCLQRMRGMGTTSGSVSGGGIYRELVTVTRGEAAASAPR